MDLNAQFRDCHLRYRNFCKSINWREFFAETDLPEKTDLLADLMAVDMGKLVLCMIEMDPTREKFGFLPYMATGSCASISKMLAQSFAERVNSAGNLVLTKGNTLLGDEEVSMLVTLRMNREFMIYVRHHPNVSRQDFKISVVTEKVNDVEPYPWRRLALWR